MYTKDYEWFLRHMMEHAGMKPSSLFFVDNVAEWCRTHGIRETDSRKPMRLVAENGTAQVIVATRIEDDVVDERITALSMRSQLKSVVVDRSEVLNSNLRKLAYLFLKETADTRPDFQGDEFAEDEWIFEQLERFGTLTP